MIGAPPGDDAAVLRQLYAGIDAPLHVAPYRVAESVKYLSNAYHAVKLAFANEAGQILSAYGVDAREAFRLFREDRTLNISPAYLRPGFAFGGSCLPKDIRSFLSLAQRKDVAAPFLHNVLTSNQAIVDRVYEAILRQGRQRVSLFGLAFKQGTDDLRESPFVTLAERLIGRGFDLRIYDRQVQVARLMGSNRAYIEREIPHIDRLLVDDPAAALEGSRLVVVGHIAPEDQPALLAALDGQTVFDLAGIPALEKKCGHRLPGPVLVTATAAPAVRQPALPVSDERRRQDPHRQYPAQPQGRRVRDRCWPHPPRPMPAPSPRILIPSATASSPGRRGAPPRGSGCWRSPRRFRSVSRPTVRPPGRRRSPGRSRRGSPTWSSPISRMPPSCCRNGPRRRW